MQKFDRLLTGRSESRCAGSSKSKKSSRDNLHFDTILVDIMGVRKMRGVECGRKTQDAPPIDIVRVGFLKKNVRREDTFIIPRKYFIKWNEQNMMGGGGRGEGQPTSLSPIVSSNYPLLLLHISPQQATGSLSLSLADIQLRYHNITNPMPHIKSSNIEEPTWRYIGY